MRFLVYHEKSEEESRPGLQFHIREALGASCASFV
jgi:hypothetical protein